MSALIATGARMLFYAFVVPLAFLVFVGLLAQTFEKSLGVVRKQFFGDTQLDDLSATTRNARARSASDSFSTQASKIAAQSMIDDARLKILSARGVNHRAEPQSDAPHQAVTPILHSPKGRSSSLEFESERRGRRKTSSFMFKRTQSHGELVKSMLQSGQVDDDGYTGVDSSTVVWSLVLVVFVGLASSMSFWFLSECVDWSSTCGDSALTDKCFSRFSPLQSEAARAIVAEIAHWACALGEMSDAAAEAGYALIYDAPEPSQETVLAVGHQALPPTGVHPLRFGVVFAMCVWGFATCLVRSSSRRLKTSTVVATAAAEELARIALLKAANKEKCRSVGSRLREFGYEVYSSSCLDGSPYLLKESVESSDVLVVVFGPVDDDVQHVEVKRRQRVRLELAAASDARKAVLIVVLAGSPMDDDEIRDVCATHPSIRVNFSLRASSPLSRVSSLDAIEVDEELDAALVLDDESHAILQRTLDDMLSASTNDGVFELYVSEPLRKIVSGNQLVVSAFDEDRQKFARVQSSLYDVRDEISDERSLALLDELERVQRATLCPTFTNRRSGIA